MPAMNLHWRVAGRPVKPVAFALAVSMLIIFVFNVVDRGVLDGSEAGDVLGSFGLVVASMFACAWGIRSQRLTEVALLGAAFVWFTRMWVIVFVTSTPFANEGFWLSALWAVLAAGSFFLEAGDQEEAGWTRL